MTETCRRLYVFVNKTTVLLCAFVGICNLYITSMHGYGSCKICLKKCMICIIVLQACLAFATLDEHSKRKSSADKLVKRWRKSLPGAFDPLLHWDIRTMYR